jgi:hypothetical protein
MQAPIVIALVIVSTSFPDSPGMIPESRIEFNS